MVKRPGYIQFEPRNTKGALHLPDKADGRAAFLVTHRSKNFMNHISARELACRGFPVLAMNPRSDNNEAAVVFEDLALDVRQGVDFLRGLGGVDYVVLIGHSGGGPTMSYYQALAENGPGFCRSPGKLTTCRETFKDFPAGDALVLLDAHPGNPVNVLRSLNPAVVDESRPYEIDKRLDPFNERNGYNATGNSTYSPQFMTAYFAGQAARMTRLIEKALTLREEMRAGRHMPADDDVFVAYRASARLADLSTGVGAGTQAEHKLLCNDGRLETRQIGSVRVATPQNAKLDVSLDGALVRTVRSFLTASAIRAKDSMVDIDWCSSNNSTPCALKAITVPVLIAAMQAHYFIEDSELFYNVAQSSDKDFIVVEGADHFMLPSAASAAVTGADYANATKNLFDFVADWTRARFS
jgi:pimeloyl-ACP methyl ester carboxylesterase